MKSIGLVNLIYVITIALVTIFCAQIETELAIKLLVFTMIIISSISVIVLIEPELSQYLKKKGGQENGL